MEFIKTDTDLLAIWVQTRNSLEGFIRAEKGHEILWYKQDPNGNFILLDDSLAEMVEEMYIQDLEIQIQDFLEQGGFAQYDYTLTNDTLKFDIT